jgi:hypothetical protein
LLHGEERDWPSIRSLVNRGSDFGKITLSRFAQEHHYSAPPLLMKIAPREVGGFWEWMLGQYPANEDPDRSRGGTVTPRWAMAELRDALVSSLADRGTAEACRELERLRAKYPQFGWFNRVLERAREQTRWNTWNPLAPSEPIALVADSRRRVVQSPDQLMQVVTEALQTVQESCMVKRLLRSFSGIPIDLRRKRR